ncbi:hypothetical protein QBC36DRAFT_364875 [Triangularia setosa]|uniref:Uncharacterized protein n=1 Tax=Triangularia setosa TaxID=2587417 RepID=A0AAN6WC65_9PEZI|nr:hypothetical protein QBC36DRAFT_364875 [Podospora setosa]
MSNKPPAYLFRLARQASVPLSSSTSTSSTSSSSSTSTRTATSISSSTTPVLDRRQAAGICRADESTCPQGGWCCKKDEICSLEAGAFFCCSTGAGKEGCVRVCTSGDFQCGGTSPDTSSTSSQKKKQRTPPSTSQTSTSSHDSAHSQTSIIKTSLPSPTPATSNPPLFSSASTTPTTTSLLFPSPTETPSPNSPGLSIPAQIAAIIVPLVIITLIASCIFRHCRKKQRGTRIQPADFTEQQNTSSGTTGTADGLSFYSAYSSYPKTPPPPPPTFSAGRLYGRDMKEEGKGEATSLHERYMMESRMFRTPTPQSPVVGKGVRMWL